MLLLSVLLFSGVMTGDGRRTSLNHSLLARSLLVAARDDAIRLGKQSSLASYRCFVAQWQLRMRAGGKRSPGWHHRQFKQASKQGGEQARSNKTREVHRGSLTLAVDRRPQKETRSGRLLFRTGLPVFAIEMFLTSPS